jgi:hypothetical protein
MRFILLAIFLPVALLGPMSAQQSAPAENAAKEGPKVDGLLFFATNDNVPEASEELAEEAKSMDQAMLADLRKRLAKAFPDQKNYELLGRHTQDVLKAYESWVVPSKDLCLKIDSRGPAPDNGVKLHVQLWQEKKVLVKCDAVLKPKTPIFIGGPNWRTGRLIFVVIQK